MPFSFLNKNFILFLIKFIFFFVLFYFGTKYIISAATPDGRYYSPFVQHYFDYISWMRNLLLKGASIVAKLFGYATQFEDPFLIRIKNGRGVFVAYSCVGYGVISFWCAYVLANQWHTWLTLGWLMLGSILITIINILRIGLFLVAINQNRRFPFGIDHHTWFNIVAYIAIFMLIFFFEKKQKSL